MMPSWSGTTEPCEIWCFVDLTSLPVNEELQVEGCLVDKGVYAVVECGQYSGQDTKSDLFLPLNKVVRATDEDGKVTKRQFYLANVEVFVAPVAVVPDVGSTDLTRYFAIKPRSEWAEQFILWLEAPHTADDMTEDDLMDMDT